MTRRSLLLPAAMGAVAGAMLALTQVFLHQRWLAPSIVAIGLAFGVGWLARRLDVPAVLSPALSLLALVVFLGIAFHRGTTMALLPTGDTLRAIGDALRQAGADIKEQAPPAEPTAALTLLATTGVFTVAALVDLVVFRARRPVAAGLPLLALFLIPTAMADKATAWAFVTASAGYLGLLVAEGRDRARSWGRRLSGIDVLDDVADVSHVARVGRRIGTAAIGIAICVPVAVPSVGRGIFEGEGSGPFGRGHGPNTAQAVNPIVDIKGQLLDDVVRPVLTVRTDDPQYLRLTTLNDFDGTSWQLVGQDAEPDHRVGAKRPVPLPSELANIETVKRHYDIKVGSLAVHWLPLPYVPDVVDVDGGDWRWEPTGLVVFSTKRTSHGVHFSADARLPLPTVDQLRAGGPIPREIRSYLTVPDDIPVRATQVLAEVTRGKTNPYDKALALNDYFASSGGFVYDLNVPQGTSEDALTSFLDNKHGYCEQFAATMAYLARLAGIPARVVVGFTPGTPDNDGVYTVTNKDAHAWPELYFPDTGWVRFEPTPRPGVDRPAYARYNTTPTPAQPSASGTPTPTPVPSASQTPGGRGADEANQNDDPGAKAAKNSAAPPVVPLGLLALLLLAAVPSSVAVATRWRRRSRAVDHVGRIHAAWTALADAAEDAGHALRAADSPRAAARRLVADAALTGEPAAEVARLAAAEERARYARSAPPADGLDAGVRAVRRALRASMSPFARVRSVVFPASALRRIRAGVRGFGERVDRNRDAARRRVLGAVRRRPRTA